LAVIDRSGYLVPAHRVALAKTGRAGLNEPGLLGRGQKASTSLPGQMVRDMTSSMNFSAAGVTPKMLRYPFSPNPPPILWFNIKTSELGYFLFTSRRQMQGFRNPEK
jgi:hypothetical protein